MTNEQTSLEKYTSHTLFERVAKGLLKGCVWKVSWRLNRLQHIDPQFLRLEQHFFSHSAGLLNRGPEGPKQSNFNCNWLQLTRNVCQTGLYNCLTSTCFLWASHLHRIQPVQGQGYILTSSTGCTYFSIDGWVEGQYVTEIISRHSWWYNWKMNRLDQNLNSAHWYRFLCQQPSLLNV